MATLPLQQPTRETGDDTLEALRTTMIETQLKPSGIVNSRTAAAFHTVAREAFVSEEDAYLAYAEAEPRIGAGRRLMRPRSLGYLIEKAKVTPEDKVLVVGAGSGYASALLAELAGGVVALESEAALATKARTLLAPWQNVRVVEGPLDAGWQEGAPYTLLLFGGMVEEIPPVFATQLAENGRAAAIVHTSGAPRAALGYKTGDTILFEPFADATAPALAAFRVKRGFEF